MGSHQSLFWPVKSPSRQVNYCMCPVKATTSCNFATTALSMNADGYYCSPISGLTSSMMSAMNINPREQDA